MQKPIKQNIYVASFWLCFSAFAPAWAAPENDWLVDPSSFKASIKEDKTRKELVMENGIVRRVIRIEPNAATVSYRMLPDGDELLRATGPEARINLDGNDYMIGGLSGQPIGNYLKDSWIANLKSDPNAYRFADWKEGPIEARFAWLKRPEWLSRDLPWPAPGRHLSMRYTPPTTIRKANATLGPALFSDDFLGNLKPDWKTSVSSSNPRSSFVNEGKVGEIYTPAETAVYAERVWPEAGSAAEVLVDAGDDTISNDWGPGFVLMAGTEPTLEFNIRPNQQMYAINGITYGKFDRSKAQRLRVRNEGGSWICEAGPEKGDLVEIAKVPVTKSPTHIRVGKCGRGGKGEDLAGHKTTDLVRSKISGISIHAAAPSGSNAASSSNASLPDVTVHYNIYDGIPLIEKWLTITNNTGKAVRINKTIVEELRYAEEESQVEPVGSWLASRLYVETDYTYCSMSGQAANRFSVQWKTDASYKSQVNYVLKTPCLLEVAPESGPAIDIPAGTEFTSIRSFELMKDTMERERSGLAQRRFYRAAAPWCQENPIIAHLISADPGKIRAMIDQAAEVGFEVIILSFGSGLNMESRDPNYQATYKALVDYGKSKGIQIGSYSLLASRSADNAADNCGGSGSRIKFGKAPCLGSKFGINYLKQISDFIANTGFSLFEHDGSYAADTCAHTNHPGHRNLEDSQWRQWEGITNLYKDLRGRGIYLNVPDWYFLNGSSKTGMGYREVNWSLPRAEQELIERQNIYDGTWEKTPSMGWMMVPLTQYHGGGQAATIEPLKDNLPHYETRLANLFGAGVQAMYRGPRLFDCDETRDIVKKWVSFYKAHRQVLDADLIHLRRPDGRDWDGWLHVNPQGKEKAMAFVYNPLEVDIEREIRLPLYYAGVKGTANVSINSGKPVKMKVSDDRNIRVKVKIAARSRSWVLVE